MICNEIYFISFFISAIQIFIFYLNLNKREILLKKMFYEKPSKIRYQHSRINRQKTKSERSQQS